MIENTINDDRTVAGGGKGMILAGRYHILRQLGQGGMGAVWLAEDRQLDNRKVAIKMLPSIIVTDKRAYDQLKGEALVSLKLIHPNIVTLRAFEENDGAPFLVMDYIDGRPLSDYLAVKGKLSEAETIKLLKPIAEALDYAHGEKVIHRDVKPPNIIIRKDGHPFILDFGIAREIQESMTRVTGGTVSGTLLYMSPEQLRGAPPAPAQDVYSFAAMVYECLNGDPPFIRGEIPYQIINENPMPLAGTPQLVASVMAGLAKKPEARPNKCAAVLGEECSSQGRVCEKVRSKVSSVKNVGQKEHKGIREGTELAGEKQIARKSHVGLSENRNWKVAPASIKSVLILLSLAILGLLTLLAVTVNDKTDTVIIPIVLGVCIWTAFWAYHIWKGRNWTRIFALAILCSCFISAIKEVVMQGADFISNIVAISFCLVIVALLFCPGSNKWFGAWPRGWSYWPLLLVLPLIVLCFENDMESTRLTKFHNEAIGRKRIVERLSDVDGCNERNDTTEDAIGQKLKVPTETISAKSFAYNVSSTDAKWHSTDNKNYHGVKHGDVKMLMLPGGATMEMIFVAPGSFMMGSKDGASNEKPAHKVKLTRGFWLGKYEVTQKQWQSVMGTNPSYCKGVNHPVDNVSWEDCQEFIHQVNIRLNYGARLPTEVEWEYACRAGTVGPYADASVNSYMADNPRSIAVLDEMGWYSANSKSQTHGVGLKRKNPWGFHDMHGNVWEWCQDRYDNDYYSRCPLNDPCNSASGKEHVMRGGCWSESAEYCRSTSRSSSNASLFSDCYFGFRLCCDRMPNE